METQDTKVVKLDSLPANRQKEGHRSPADRVIVEMRAICTRHLTELMQRLFAVIDDELFKRSDKSESVAQQSLYFGAMRHIRVESANLQSNFHFRIARGYDEFWKVKGKGAGSHPAGKPPASKEEEFSLVENDALEEEIAISAMIEKGNNLFQNQLLSLNKRIAFLLERDELDSDENPLSPFVLCRAFADAIQPLSIDVTVKLLVYKLFDQVVLSALGRLYHELNAFLVNEGILPTLAKSIRRSGSAGGAYSGSQGQGGEGDEGALEGQQAYIEVFQGMQRLLDGWRSQMGLSQGDGLRGGPAIAADEVLSALNALQSPGAPMIAAPIGTEGLKSYVTDQLVKLQPGDDRSLARPEEDIIDMVALIFDFILEDRNLPESVKGLIARLQIPVVKVAIIEKSFFGRKNHPVRLLLNALAQAGIGIDTAEGVTETPIFKKIESVVTRILDEFDQNVGLFSDLLDEFMAFMEKETQRSRIAEERTRQVTQSKEQLHLAKRKVAYEIATRLEGKATPAAVRSFLFNVWKDVLVLAYLRRDKQPGDWENALEVVDKLIWSVSIPADAAERKAILQVIPRLLKVIRSGLESISLDPQSVATVLKDLEACHVMRLSRSGEQEEVPEIRSESILAEENAMIEIRDPELAQAITEIKANLPDIENLSVRDLGRSSDELAFSGQPSDFVVEDEFLWKARELEVGEWVEFDDGNKRIRGKLSWKSQVTSTYVFVNRKGAKVLDISLSDLAKRMSEKTAQVIEDAGTPLMDRAFGALMNKLKSPVAKTA